MSEINIAGSIEADNINLGGKQFVQVPEPLFTKANEYRKVYKFALMEIKDLIDHAVINTYEEEVIELTKAINSVIDKALDVE